MPPAKSTRAPRPRVSAPQPEVVDPQWILKAIGAVLALGLLCAYLTLCVFFYLGQWQLVLHPSRAVPLTPVTQGLSFTPVRFGDDAGGQPQLAGWWIPSDTPADPTVLMLHSGDGSRSDALPMAKALHDARLNILLFDYRGYGESGARHPTQGSMQEDAGSALDFLTATRAIPLSRIVVFGSGLGASIATRLCARTPVPALILNSADGDTESRIRRDQRSLLIPLGLLFRERFPLADTLANLHTPKLLISYTQGNAPLELERAADPKMTVELPRNATPDAVTVSVRRFLSTYIPEPPPQLPAPKPR